jgi:hypothetical protein
VSNLRGPGRRNVTWPVCIEPRPPEAECSLQCRTGRCHRELSEGSGDNDFIELLGSSNAPQIVLGRLVDQVLHALAMFPLKSPHPERGLIASGLRYAFFRRPGVSGHLLGHAIFEECGKVTERVLAHPG